MNTLTTALVSSESSVYLPGSEDWFCIYHLCGLWFSYLALHLEPHGKLKKIPMPGTSLHPHSAPTRGWNWASVWLCHEVVFRVPK